MQKAPVVSEGMSVAGAHLTGLCVKRAKSTVVLLDDAPEAVHAAPCGYGAVVFHLYHASCAQEGAV